MKKELWATKELVLKNIANIRRLEFNQNAVRRDIVSRFSDDEEFLRKIIVLDRLTFKYCPEKIRNDKKIAAYVIKKFPYLRNFLGTELKKELENLKGNEIEYLFIDDDLESLIDKDFADELFESGVETIFEHTSKKIKGNRQLIKDRLEKGAAWYLFEATPELRKDMELWTIAIEKDPDIYTDSRATFAHKKKELTLLAIEGTKNNDVLKYASEELKDDEEVVAAAVKKDILNIKYASTRFQADEKISFLAFENGMRKMYRYQNLDPENGQDFYILSFISEYQDLPKATLINFNKFIKELRASGKELEELEKEYIK